MGFNGGNGGLTPPVDAVDIANGSVTNTEFEYINTLSSNAQTQLNNKQAIVAGVDDTEIGYLNGVTSSIQTQLNSKVRGSLIPITGGQPDQVGSTQYTTFNMSGASASETNVQAPLESCVLKNFRIRILTNSSTGSSAVTLRNNGVNTSVTFTIGAGATGIFSDLSNTATYADNDLVSISWGAATTNVYVLSAGSIECDIT